MPRCNACGCVNTRSMSFTGEHGTWAAESFATRPATVQRRTSWSRDGVKGVAVGDAALERREARIGDEVAAADAPHEAFEQVLDAGPDHDPAVGGLERLVGHKVRMLGAPFAAADAGRQVLHAGVDQE